MLFTEKDLLNAFKANVDNKGWIYFVGNPESNAKFIIDYIKEHKEGINEEELDKLAEEYIQGFDYAIEISPNLLSLKKDRALAKSVFKAGYRKAIYRYI